MDGSKRKRSRGTGSESTDPSKYKQQRSSAPLRSLVEPQQMFNKDVNAGYLKEVIPLVLKWLPKTSILNLRRVCKRVRNSVDVVLEHLDLLRSHANLNLFPGLVPPHQDPREFSRRHILLPSFGDTNVIIDSAEKVDSLGLDIEENRITTLVTKSLSFKFCWNNASNPSPGFLDASLELLKLDMLREQVVHLSISGDAVRTSDPTLTYDMIRRFVASLPALRLVSCVDLPAFCDIGVGAAARLERHIVKGRPLPPAPLASLTIDGDPFGRLSVPLFQEIARRYGTTLSRLSIILLEDDLRNVTLDPVYNFPVLLSLELRRASWLWHPILARIQAPLLEQLEWKFSHPALPYGVSPATLLLRTVLQFPSLQKLTLKITTGVVEDHRGAMEEFVEKRHESMKHLKIEGCGYNVPLQFFAGFFPNLESIEVGRRYFLGRRATVWPDSDLCRQNRMEESRLWSHLPKLTEFRCDTYLCTRVDAEAFQNRRP